MFAAQQGLSVCCQVLLEAGAAVELANDEGFTALHFAALNSHEESVRVLLAAGADPNLVMKV